MYLFIYVGRALHCHKNIDITDMMHSDESFPLELYKCTNVYQERPGRYDQKWLEWYLSPPLFICLLCTDCLCLLWACARCCTVTIITTSNLSLGTICDQTILNISSQFFSWHFFSMTLWTKVNLIGTKDKRCKKNDAMLSHNKISCFLISRVLSSDFIRCCCRVKVISQNFR